MTAAGILTIIAELLPAAVSLLDLFTRKKERRRYLGGNVEYSISIPYSRGGSYPFWPSPVLGAGIGGAAKDDKEQKLWIDLLKAKTERRGIPGIERAKKAIELYNTLTPDMKRELFEEFPELINKLETIAKAYKESPLLPPEKDKILQELITRLHFIEERLRKLMAPELKGITEIPESPYVWVTQVLPDGRIVREFKRREEVFKTIPLPEAKEDIAEKMARERTATLEQLYEIAPTFLQKEREKAIQERLRKEQEAEEKRREEIKKLKEAQKEVLKEFYEEIQKLPQEEILSPQEEEKKEPEAVKIPYKEIDEKLRYEPSEETLKLFSDLVSLSKDIRKPKEINRIQYYEFVYETLLTRIFQEIEKLKKENKNRYGSRFTKSMILIIITDHFSPFTTAENLDKFKNIVLRLIDKYLPKSGNYISTADIINLLLALPRAFIEIGFATEE